MQAFTVHCQSVGVRFRPYRTAEFAHFRNLPHGKQSEILASFLNFYKIIVSSSEANIQTTDSRSVIWHMFSKMGWVPCSDLFDFIKNDDIVEVYDTSFHQVFRNLRFIQICSYSFEEIVSFEWPQLFKRTEEDSGHLLETSRQLISGEIRHTVVPETGRHTIEEIFSEERRVFAGIHKCLSPIFDKNHNPIGFVGVTSAEVIATLAVIPSPSVAPENGFSGGLLASK